MVMIMRRMVEMIVMKVEIILTIGDDTGDAGDGEWW